jgi:hypothetical protein
MAHGDPMTEIVLLPTMHNALLLLCMLLVGCWLAMQEMEAGT